VVFTDRGSPAIETRDAGAGRCEPYVFSGNDILMWLVLFVHMHCSYTSTRPSVPGGREAVSFSTAGCVRVIVFDGLVLYFICMVRVVCVLRVYTRV
jgi:hypothetical protein